MKLRMLIVVLLTGLLLATPRISRADYIFVSNYDSNSIVEFDSSGTGTVFAASGLNNPTGMAFDQNGNLYVANFGNNTIVRFDASGAASIFATSGLDGPAGMTFDDNGNLYVANDTGDFSSGSVVEFHASNGVLTTNVTWVFTELAYPLQVAWNQPQQDLFVSQGDHVLDLKGGQFGWTPVGGLACDAAGADYAAYYYYGYIAIWYPSGYAWWLPGKYEITAMAFDSEGNLYAASAYNNNILKYDNNILNYGSSGNYTVFASSDLSWGIAVRPVTAGPTITLIGGDPMTNQCHAAFTDPGATASENGVDLSSNIVVSGTVDADAPGDYTLTYTVADAFKSSTSTTRTVVVVDTALPVITCPAEIVVNAVCPQGALVSFTVTATDECTSVSVTNVPSSGSLFAIGDTTVTSTAVDAAGNQATCSFNLHVKGAEEQIDDLIGCVRGLRLNPWAVNNLVWDLQAASNALRRGNSRFACGELDMFIFNVDALTWWGQIRPPFVGRNLIRNAQRIQNVLGCRDRFGDGRP